QDNTTFTNTYLQQLRKTPFFQNQKPTPYDQPTNTTRFLENVFYLAAGHISTSLKNKFPSPVNDQNTMIRMGFWPGGDRDGNPFVKADTTIKVASALRASAIKSYYLDVRKLKRRLTFKVVDQLLAGLESKLYKALFFPHQK